MRSLLAAIVALGATGSTASAELVFHNGFPDESDAFSRSISSFRTADDFAIEGSAEVTSIRFWMVSEEGSYEESFSYAFHRDADGDLGSVVASGTVSEIGAVLVNEIPVHIYEMFRVDFDLAAPVFLGTGTHWLELHYGPSLTTDTPAPVLWARVADVSGNAKQSPVPTRPSGYTGNELAFALYGTLPEPDAASGFVALAGLAWQARRREGRA